MSTIGSVASASVASLAASYLQRPQPATQPPVVTDADGDTDGTTAQAASSFSSAPGRALDVFA